MVCHKLLHARILQWPILFVTSSCPQIVEAFCFQVTQIVTFHVTKNSSMVPTVKIESWNKKRSKTPTADFALS